MSVNIDPYPPPEKPEKFHGDDQSGKVELKSKPVGDQTQEVIKKPIRDSLEKCPPDATELTEMTFVDMANNGNDYSTVEQTWNGANCSGDEECEVIGDFSDNSIRHGFIRKVFFLVILQLGFYLASIASFIYIPSIRSFVDDHLNFVIGVLFTFSLGVFVLICCGEIRRKFPHNYILLVFFTLTQSSILGIVSLYHPTEDMVMAFSVTGVVCLCLILFSFQKKWAITMFGGSLFAVALISIILGIFAAIVSNKTFVMAYASLLALLLSVYLIGDIHLMMSGKHKYIISHKEYTFAAMNLNLDTLTICAYLVTLIGRKIQSKVKSCGETAQTIPN